MKYENRTTEQDLQDRILRVEVIAENRTDNELLAKASGLETNADSVTLIAKIEKKAMSEVEFENLVCDVWTQSIKNDIQDYRKKHQIEPTGFEKASWMAREILKRVGFNLER